MINKTEAEQLTWQEAKKNIQKILKEFPNLIDDCLDTAYLHGLEESKNKMSEQKAKMVEEIKKLKEKWTPTEGYGSEEELGFQKGIVAQINLKNSQIDELISIINKQ